MKNEAPLSHQQNSLSETRTHQIKNENTLFSNARFVPDRAFHPSRVPIILLQKTIGNRALSKILKNRSRGSVLQRAKVNYIEQVVGDEAKPYLQSFDETITKIAGQLQTTQEPVAADLREALASLQSLRSSGKITCWRVSGGLTYASYDNGSGEIRLHINIGQAARSQVALVHEAIHAVHANRYPRIAKMYAEVLAAGGTKDESVGVLLLKWKAWTEYWAYRRAIEYDNLRQSPEFRRNADREARQERDVMGSIARVREQTGEEFEPSAWNPPAQYLVKTPQNSSSKK